MEDHDLVVCGGYPGKLRDILGVWVEEIDALPAEESNSFIYNGKEYPASLCCDLMHLEWAKEISHYESDFYKGMPVITRNSFGKGNAYYVGTRSNEDFYKAFLGEICDKLEIQPVAHTPEGVEATVRVNANGEFLFLLNHNEYDETITMEQDGCDLLTGQKYTAGETLNLPKAGVAIIQKGN